MPDQPRFILYSRSYCHLCDDLLAALRKLVGDEISVNVIDIDLHTELVQRYDELVPVLIGCRDGQPEQQLCHYFLDENAVKGFLSSHPD
ncbi:Glutaredoxin-like [Oxalobacteraceae bacterium]